MTHYRTFHQAQRNLEARFRAYAKKIHTKKWQGQDIALRPDMVSWELLNETISVDLFGNDDLKVWQQDIKPNLPWADDHFLERVSGAPLNPGTQWRNWPWASSADKHRKDEMFNHTYMERLWPRHAGQSLKPSKTPEEFRQGREYWLLNDVKDEPNFGIRGEYGDLGTLVDKLAHEPDTRQAYIPLYFPEDTGLEGRMPCTLGYQFIMRDGVLHIYYPMRSCDFVRHWGDDCYLAVRLLLWMIEQCRERNPADWKNVKPGTFTMHCTSLHVFANDAIKMGIER
jgi:hypothetical protein